MTEAKKTVWVFTLMQPIFLCMFMQKKMFMLMVMHPDNSKRDILVIGELPTDGLGDTTITTEAKYFFIITKSGKRIAWLFATRPPIVFVCVWCKDPLIQTRGLWNISYPLCLGKILKEFTADDMKKLDLI